MKFRWNAILVVGLMASLAAAGQEGTKKSPAKADGDTTMKTLNEKASYIIGLNTGKGLKNDSMEVDLSLFMKGIKDGLSGSKPVLTEKEIHEVMMAFQKELEEKQAGRAKESSEKNKKEGDAFLAENKKKEGVKTTTSGLQYKVIKAGNGKIPKATDTVTTHYRGTLIDGTVFDSSYDRSQPESFPVTGVIKGWTEALQMMPVGSKWQLFVPSKLAYGERGAPPDIGPNATLIFEVELIAIK